ncbi:R3H domain-containing protein 2-like isoform X2 [Olea europaea var. sylvestris]|uniref:R3H domain-containing 1-like isoform X1 n=2 Tax=Olea europaea subsp. europaea TaxID=158383 RepID=A0A8S0T5D1_OLEEU|nr:R3H domain-containing protein 2-like isoform X2 [Olea europaea var. sylvestris]CAA2999027.1 R3H domain-containing 1-like isoform X1 [Olea europaea subsp. europaea]
MSLTEFAMVEELASLIKDNLPCKHLILSMEEALINFLQDDTRLDGVLELEPMNSYNRLLVHRLADIFGFSHHSVGEGDERHLILERCLETSMPSILVSDLLWQYDDLQSPTNIEVLRRKEVQPGESQNSGTESSHERKTTPFTSRERIFLADERETGLVKQRPQYDPKVARRMITHALGQRIKSTNHEPSLRDNKKYGHPVKDVRVQPEEEGAIKSSSHTETEVPSTTYPEPARFNVHEQRSQRTSFKTNLSADEREESNIQNDSSGKELMGAAKRLFANALGIHQREGNPSKCNETRQTKLT